MKLLKSILTLSLVALCQTTKSVDSQKNESQQDELTEQILKHEESQKGFFEKISQTLFGAEEWQKCTKKCVQFNLEDLTQNGIRRTLNYMQDPVHRKMSDNQILNETLPVGARYLLKGKHAQGWSTKMICQFRQCLALRLKYLRDQKKTCSKRLTVCKNEFQKIL